MEDTFTNTSTMPVMMVDTSTIEERLKILIKMVGSLMTHSKKQYRIIAQLMSNNASLIKLYKGVLRQHKRILPQSKEKNPMILDHSKLLKNNLNSCFYWWTQSNEWIGEFHSWYDKDKYARNLKSSFAYLKLYSRKIDSLKMSVDYFPPKVVAVWWKR